LITLVVPHVSWSQLGDISENKDIQALEALRLQNAPDTENQHFKTTNQHLNDAKDKSNGSGVVNPTDSNFGTFEP
jgi:hypothetical protein